MVLFFKILPCLSQESSPCSQSFPALSWLYFTGFSSMIGYQLYFFPTVTFPVPFVDAFPAGAQPSCLAPGLHVWLVCILSLIWALGLFPHLSCTCTDSLLLNHYSSVVNTNTVEQVTLTLFFLLAHKIKNQPANFNEKFFYSLYSNLCISLGGFSVIHECISLYLVLPSWNTTFFFRRGIVHLS
jgi:hypothetical protein